MIDSVIFNDRELTLGVGAKSKFTPPDIVFTITTVEGPSASLIPLRIVNARVERARFNTLQGIRRVI